MITGHVTKLIIDLCCHTIHRDYLNNLCNVGKYEKISMTQLVQFYHSLEDIVSILTFYFVLNIIFFNQGVRLEYDFGFLHMRVHILDNPEELWYDPSPLFIIHSFDFHILWFSFYFFSYHPVFRRYTSSTLEQVNKRRF